MGSFGGKHYIRLIGAGTVGAALALTSNATIYTFTIPARATPIRSGFIMTTGSATGPSTVTFTNASTGDCGTLTIPLTATAGKIYYEKTDYVSGDTGTWKGILAKGARVTCIVSATTDTTGAGVPFMDLEENSDTAANDSNMVAA